MSAIATTGQVSLLAASLACFAGGLGASVARLWWDKPLLKASSRAMIVVGVGLGLACLVWHSMTRGSWLPLEDNFDAFTWLGLLVAIFLLYVQSARPLRGLDWFLLPAVILLLALAIVFGLTRSHEYSVYSAWLWAHRVTAYGGVAAFAVSAAVGAMYLISRRKLRDRTAPPTQSLGNLERLEQLTQSSVTLGFALLTIGLVTGFVRVFEPGGTAALGHRWFASPKVLLAMGVWVVYALALHTPINPSFRGRKAAVLSVVGFALMIATLVAVQFMPDAAR